MKMILKTLIFLLALCAVCILIHYGSGYMANWVVSTSTTPLP